MDLRQLHHCCEPIRQAIHHVSHFGDSTGQLRQISSQNFYISRQGFMTLSKPVGPFFDRLPFPNSSLNMEICASDPLDWKPQLATSAARLRRASSGNTCFSAASAVRP